MEKSDNHHFFTLFGLYFLGLGWLAAILSMLGIFYGWILAFYIILGAAYLAYFISKNKINFKPDRSLAIIIVLVVAFIVLWSHFTSPTIFSGRDQGSLSEAAAHLSQNHQLKFSFPASLEFFKIYGPGKALNFPGFDYAKGGQLITQFPIGYISWLAVFYSFFGIFGFVLANAAAFFVFALSFYKLAKIYLNGHFPLIAVLFVLTSFVFSWFFKFTLSENLALALTWFGLLEFAIFLESRKRIHILAALASFFLLLFSRVEALAFLPVIFIILFVTFRQLKKIYRAIGKNISLVILAMAVVYILSLWVNFDFYLTFIKGFFNSFSPNDLRPTPTSRVNIFSPLIYIVKVFSVYALIDFLILGIFGMAILLKKKNFKMLVPALVLLPSFVYLVHPGISSDHPWMLRRYLFAVIPAGILYTAIFLENYFSKKIYAYVLSVILIAANLPVFLTYLPFSENEGFLAQTETIGANFQNSDLVLVDRDATGSGWAMMSGPLNFIFGKQAVYFFNPADLDKIDKSKFSNIYLVIPDQNLAGYLKYELMEKLVAIKNYEISNNTLDTENSDANVTWNSPVQLPAIQKNITYGKIYLLRK
jgi:hypothetical protein